MLDCSTSGRAVQCGSPLSAASRALLRSGQGRPAARHARRAAAPPCAIWRLVGGRSPKEQATHDAVSRANNEADAIAARLAVAGLSATELAKLRGYTEAAYLTGRTRVVTELFPEALGVDDFLHRLEIALFAFGFNGDNSIGARAAMCGVRRGGLPLLLPATALPPQATDPAPLSPRRMQRWSTCAATRSPLP
jgi:hypothetical protein